MKIEVGQFSSLMRRYLGSAGASEVLTELAPEASAGFTLESERPEWEFLKGARLMAWTGQTGPTVGQPGAAKLRNPPTSGMIAIVDYIELSSTLETGYAITKGAGTTDLGTISGTVTRDTRLTTQSGAMVASFQDTGPGGNAAALVATILAKTVWPHRGIYVITPGNFIAMQTTLLNVNLQWTIHWLEKRLDALEAS